MDPRARDLGPAAGAAQGGAPGSGGEVSGAGAGALPEGAAAALAAATAPRGVSGTFYAPGTFPRSKPAAPPIFRTVGGGRRPEENIQIDITLRAAASSAELLRFLGDALPRFDTANVVVAFTTAAKLDEGRDMATLNHSPAWAALQERLIACADSLEPRGMSMSAYAAAKLVWGDSRLLDALARAGARRAADFGATDVAKGCWAFAKLRFVEGPLAQEFWSKVGREAPRTIAAARFVDVSMVAWAFAITGHGHPDIYSEVGAATRAALGELPPRSLAGVAWACAKGGHGDAQLFAAISQRALDMAADFTAHDAAALCWAFSAAGRADRALFEAIADHLTQQGALRRLSPPLAAELAWGFAAARVAHAPLLVELEGLCAQHIEELETEDVVGFAWAFAALGRREPAPFRALAAYAERFGKRLTGDERRIISWALAEAGFGDAGRAPGASGLLAASGAAGPLAASCVADGPAACGAGSADCA